MAWSWTGDTRPFTRPDGTVPAEFVLRQVDDDWFALESPFVYDRRDGAEPLLVTNEALGDTDLASVPWFMLWFASRYGRHTPAALVHDQLTPDRGSGRGYHEARRAADRVILQAMDDTDVAPVRSRVIWSAVVMATRFADRWLGFLGIVAWFACAVAGTVVLVIGILDVQPLLIAAGLLGPLAGALLWGRDYWAGVIGGYALWGLFLPALTSIGVHYVVYWPLEKAVQVGRGRIGANRGKRLPGPVPYRRS